MGYLRRQIVTAALTANAIRPLPGFRVGIPAFFAGWLTGEMAPHVLALTAGDTAAQLAVRRGRRPQPLALALAGASMAGLGYLIAQARHAGDEAEEQLVAGLGEQYREALEQQPTPADLAIRWSRIAYPFRPTLKGVRVVRDVPYDPAHGKRGLLDIYLPDGATLERAPVLLQVHGGGWSIGNKDQQGLPLMNHLAARGWVCVAINYRLSPRSAFPAHIVDVKRAIAWIKEHIAEYGGDPDYVAITGGSAGGHLCALAALTPNDPDYQPGFEDADTAVQCAVPHYGVYDFTGSSGSRKAVLLRDRFLAPIVFQRSYEEDPDAFAAASPLLRVTPEAPDMFVIHGKQDTLVPVEQARLLVDRLKAGSERTVVYAELPGAQHAFDVFSSIRSQHIVHAIERYLTWHWNTWRRDRTGVANPTDSA